MLCTLLCLVFSSTVIAAEHTPSNKTQSIYEALFYYPLSGVLSLKRTSSEEREFLKHAKQAQQEVLARLREELKLKLLESRIETDDIRNGRIEMYMRSVINKKDKETCKKQWLKKKKALNALTVKYLAARKKYFQHLSIPQAYFPRPIVIHYKFRQPLKSSNARTMKQFIADSLKYDPTLSLQRLAFKVYKSVPYYKRRKSYDSIRSNIRARKVFVEQQAINAWSESHKNTEASIQKALVVEDDIFDICSEYRAQFRPITDCLQAIERARQEMTKTKQVYAKLENARKVANALISPLDGLSLYVPKPPVFLNKKR